HCNILIAMKTIFFALLFVFVSSTAANATTRHTEDNSQLLHIIRTQLHLPETLKKEAAGKAVTVFFIVNEKGRMQISRIEGADPEIETSIRQQLEGMPVNNIPVYENREYNFTMRFKAE